MEIENLSSGRSVELTQEQFDEDVAMFLLTAFPPLPEREAGGVTEEEAATVWNLTGRAARSRLIRLEKAGAMRRSTFRGKGNKETDIWYRVNDET